MQSKNIFRLLLLSIFVVSHAREEVILETILTCPQVFHVDYFDQRLKNFNLDSDLQGSFYTCDRFLFSEYPALKEQLPWVELAQLPTPVRRLEQLGVLLGHDQFYLKDDGQTGQQIGGNKLRKLEVVLADVVYQGARDVVTFGCIGSNLVTEVAFCAKKLGLGCKVFLKPEPNSSMVQNNLLLNYLYDAKMYFYKNEDIRKLCSFAQILKHKYDKEFFPYAVPTGASSPLGAIGYVNAAFELKDQIKQGLMPKPDYIYIAVGSVGTVAGLALGLRLAEIDSHIIAVGADYEKYEPVFIELVTKCNELLQGLDSTFPSFDASSLPVTFNYDFVGKGYAHFSQEGTQAIKIFKEQENLELDGVYSGKCAAALIDHIATKKELQDKVILFWNTFGIHQKVTNRELYKKLPEQLHQFFENTISEDAIG